MIGQLGNATDSGHRLSSAHVLILPSEQFQPRESHLAGIFQLHQARALKQLGYRVGVISISQRYSAPMLTKAAGMRLFGKQHERVSEKSILGLGRLLWNKLFRVQKFIQHETIQELPVCRIEGFYFSRPGPAKNYRGWIRAGMAAFEEYQQRSGLPDLIHAHNCDAAGMLADKIKQKYKVPYVLTAHSSYLHRGLIPESLYPGISSSLRNADSVLVVSPKLKEAISAKLGDVADSATWLPNVLDPELESLPLSRSQPAKQPTRFLAIGGLIPLKGHAGLITAFAQAFPGNDPRQAVLRIAGDGSEKSNLNTLIDSLGVRETVQLLGRIQRNQVVEELDNSHCLVLNSEFETFGVVLIEAMSRGKPVIATACGGPDCVVDEETGILIPTHDQDSLTKALCEIASDARKFDPQTIRKSVIDRFGRRTFGESLRKIYDQILDENSA